MADAQVDSMASQSVFKEPVSSTEKQDSLKPTFGKRNEVERITAAVEDRQGGQKPSTIEVLKHNGNRDSTRQRVSNKKKEVIAEKVTGTVKWFNVKYGYGFISRNDTKEDVFVHQTGIVRNNPNKVMRSVGDGEQVEFSVVAGVKGNEAAYVTGPSGRPVRGSPYVADRRYYRRPAYPQKQLDGSTSGRPGIETQDQKGVQQKYYRRYFRSSPRNRYPKEQNVSSSQPEKEIGKGDEIKPTNNVGQAVDDSNADRGDAPVEDLKPVNVVDNKLQELEATKTAESQGATEVKSQNASGKESIQIHSNICDEKVVSVDNNDRIEPSVLTTENTVFDNSSIITVIEEIAVSDSINHEPECVK